MEQTAEYTLDKLEEVWTWWKGDINSWRSQTAMRRIHKILTDANKELLEDQGCEPMNTTTEHKEEQKRSTAMAAEIVLLLKARNYGSAEAKATALVGRLMDEEEQAKIDRDRFTLAAEPYAFIEVIEWHIENIDATIGRIGKTSFVAGRRNGFRCALEIYRGSIDMQRGEI